MKTYNEVYIEARKRLRRAGVKMFELEARLIMSRASGRSQEEFLRDSRLFVTDDAFEQTVSELIARREKGEPVAYIVGQWEFFGIPLAVTEDVLIPRIDTEVLTGASIEILRRKGGETRALDLCAGSGCVGIAIAVYVPSCRVIMAEKSPAALKICKQNILRAGVSRNATSVEADATAEPPLLLGRFDLIACNPPYIPTGDLATLDESVRLYEPLKALDGGEDGLDFFRSVCSEWQVLLKDDGYLAFECGIGQSEAVADIMEAAGFLDIGVLSDTGGIDRVVIGRQGFK